MLQPADSFVIQKLKDEFREQRNIHCFKAIKNEIFKNRVKPYWSGRLGYPGNEVNWNMAPNVLQYFHGKVDEKA